MAPRTSKNTKRSEKDVLEKDAATKVAKEQPDQTAGAAAAKKIPEAVKEVQQPVDSEPVKTDNGAKDDREPAKVVQGDPLADAAAAKEANGVAKEEPEQATAAAVEAGKTKEAEEPEGEEEDEEVVEPAIGEAKPLTEAE